MCPLKVKCCHDCKYSKEALCDYPSHYSDNLFPVSPLLRPSLDILPTLCYLLSMTTSDITTVSLNRAGNKRGMHPNCRKALRPGNPIVDIHMKPGYSLTSRLKKAMERPLQKPKPDAPAGDHIVYATLTGAKDLVPVAFKEAWDRTEGKVPDRIQADIRQISIVEVVSDGKPIPGKSYRELIEIGNPDNPQLPAGQT